MSENMFKGIHNDSKVMVKIAPDENMHVLDKVDFLGNSYVRLYDIPFLCVWLQGYEIRFDHVGKPRRCPSAGVMLLLCVSPQTEKILARIQGRVIFVVLLAPSKTQTGRLIKHGTAEMVDILLTSPS